MYYYYYYYYLTPVLNSRGIKNYAMQYKKYKNQAGMNLTLPPPSQNSHYYYYYAAFNAPCVGHQDDESQARCAHVPDYFGNLLLTLRFRFVFRLS